MSYINGLKLINAISESVKRMRRSGELGRSVVAEQLQDVLSDIEKSIEIASKLEEAIASSDKGMLASKICNWHLIKVGNSISLRRFKPLITLTYDATLNTALVSSKKSFIKLSANGLEVGSGHLKVSTYLTSESMAENSILLTALLKKVAPIVNKLVSDLSNCAKASRIRT